MIRINQIKCLPEHTEKDLLLQIRNTLKVKEEDILSYEISKKSIDARKKPEIWLSYVVDVKVRDEKALLKKNKNPNVVLSESITYQFPAHGTESMDKQPVIIGMGPAGLFCGYLLSQNGYRPILLERGEPVESRTLTVNKFWESGILDGNSNVQFGEGGAGTFSDGKLNTLVKDKFGRNRKVLEILVENGAPEAILYENKPHIGTDILSDVVINIRNKIIEMGGQVRFNCQVTDLLLDEDQKIKGVMINKTEELLTNQVILAIGHSARDTFRMLYEKNIPMEAKSFAVGLRVEHPQKLITMSQYGTLDKALPTAAYKLTAQVSEKRGVYSFCMCPGGFVVNASSEESRLAVNGMSYSKRDGDNANSAIIVSVSPEDFSDNHPLAGLAFQEKMEEAAFSLCTRKGSVPVETFGDFYADVINSPYQYSGNDRKLEQNKDFFKDFKPAIKGGFEYAKVSAIMPEELNHAFIKGMLSFERIIPGFAYSEVLLEGIESRTSSPVRITRNENKESLVSGLYPCGEGAGYAGGIMSAAMDGILIAECIAEKFQSF